MGRGNVCTFGDYEGLYYLDNEFLSVYRKSGSNLNEDMEEFLTIRELDEAGISYYENSEWEYDEFESRCNWEYMIEYMQKKLAIRFQSFNKVDFWKDRDRHIVLQNAIFEIAIVDNEWSAAWCLLERWDVDERKGLLQHHYQTYLEGIKQALLEFYGECRGYGNPWVAGEIFTR
ncbi:MAG: hypothetical protein LBR56_07005 [Sporomusaceae bacterium]|jgi:hypothetical protein|nr:hypothetical protein [Sporomusaceae bacterium]